MLNQKGLSIKKIRNTLYVVVLLSISVSAFSVSVLVDMIFDNFGPAVEKDLNWKAAHGAKELAQSADLGLAVLDEEMVKNAFEDYVSDLDVASVVAVTPDHEIIASHGQSNVSTSQLFSSEQTNTIQTPEYIYAWRQAEIEGSEVGKVGLIISTKRIVESKQLLEQIQFGTVVACLTALLFGFAVLSFFSSLVLRRDQQLADYAATLEDKVAQRTAELDARNVGMRLVLDNVQDGFVTFNVNGSIEEERSAIVDTWINPPTSTMKIWEYIEQVEPRAAQWLQLGLEQLWEDILPTEIILSQLPSRIQSGKRTLSAEYIPITKDNKIDQFVLVLRDITSQLENERNEIEQRETLEIFQRIAKDKSGFVNFKNETQQMIEQLVEDDTISLPVAKRLIHTVKGNCAFFGLSTIARTCHHIEDVLEENEEAWGLELRKDIENTWGEANKRIKTLIGNENEKSIELSFDEYRFFHELILSGIPHSEISRVISCWRHDPVEKRFNQLSDQAYNTAKKLKKLNVEIECHHNYIHLDNGHWSPFWSAMTHAVNNAVDHGLEHEQERIEHGKQPIGKLILIAEQDHQSTRIVVQDDGRGINWQRLKEKAEEQRISAETEEDFLNLLFSDGISSKNDVSIVSGRGIGMGAVRGVVSEMGGTINVTSNKHEGTKFEFIIPHRVEKSSDVMNITKDSNQQSQQMSNHV